MKKFFFLAFSLVVVCVSGNEDQVGESSCDEQPDKCNSQRRRLHNKVHGPCTGFAYAEDKNPTCPSPPDVNPNVQAPNGLSIFARDWIDYTCCNIVSKEMREIIPSVWLWLQVCTNAMNFANDKSYILDKEFEKTGNVTSYQGGPLHNMRRYCPTDLDGGKLTEFVVATFFPVMEEYNKHFKEFDHNVSTCEIDRKNNGAATLLLTEPNTNGTFGHLAMIVHEDVTKPQELPKDDDKKRYVSFTNMRRTVGVMITGTKARHVGFGRDLENVDKTVTVYNVDAKKVLEAWDLTKTSNQMFDLMNWNCARTVLEALQKGYPNCDMHLEQLWTPTRAFEFIQDVKKATHPRVITAPSPYDVTVKAIRARQIPPEVRIKTEIQAGEVPWALIIGIALGTFFLNLALVVLVLGVVIWRMKANAEKKLEKGLAKLLIRGRAPQPRPSHENAAIAPTTSGDESSSPSNLHFPPDLPGSELPLESPRFTDAIVEEMDDGYQDGMIDFKEFSAWAKKHNLDESQRKLMWKELDKDKDGQVSKDEWDLFIQKRPRLKWLVTRLRSMHYR